MSSYSDLPKVGDITEYEGKKCEIVDILPVYSPWKPGMQAPRQLIGYTLGLKFLNKLNGDSNADI